MRIHRWKDIRIRFRQGLLLGNGASIAIDKRFDYSSLLEHAIQHDLTTTRIANIFSRFETTDFEYTLRMLRHAAVVNRALGIKDAKTRPAYDELRAALIKSVRSLHVEHDEVAVKLETMAKFLKRFRTVVSLNYDSLVYWAMLAGNTARNHQWFKDCFLNGVFAHEWEWLRRSRGDAKGTTLVFYPHGNLVLATDGYGQERKIATDEESTLLDTVATKWESGQYTPLFISEGTSQQKLRAIQRSPYLLNVYTSVLPNLGSHVVLFGWSVGEQDDHILTALCANRKLEALAVSVFGTEERQQDMGVAITRRIRKASGKRKLSVTFFGAENPGCWIQPE